MKANPNFLQVEGNQIVNGQGEVVRLRGFCLGGWMNLENFMIGYPGHETGFRRAISNVLGEETGSFFFDRLLHYFISQDDLVFIKSLGCNVLRIALNYRHFESDAYPFAYKSEGFKLLDKVTSWARELELYIILDLHAVQGWQNGGWHCDNPDGTAHFWGQKHFEERATRLWEEIARRYRDEPFIAGYNLMNEPETHNVDLLNRFYRRATAAIRAIDPDHIIFLEGNQYSQRFDQLDPPFDANLVYSSHLYIPPGFDEIHYPGELNGVNYNHDWLEEFYLRQTAFTREYNVPHWLGEFGCIHGNPDFVSSRLSLMRDYFDILEEQGDHWTIWNYKDIGKMGIIYVDPQSEWMKHTQQVRAIKTQLRCDSWIERISPDIDPQLEALSAQIKFITKDRPGDWDLINEFLGFAIGDRLISNMLLPAFAEQFKEMNESDIDKMMQSFAFRNCIQRDGLVKLIRERFSS